MSILKVSAIRIGTSICGILIDIEGDQLMKTAGPLQPTLSP